MSNLINNEWLENQKNSDCLDLKLLERKFKKYFRPTYFKSES